MMLLYEMYEIAPTDGKKRGRKTARFYNREKTATLFNYTADGKNMLANARLRSKEKERNLRKGSAEDIIVINKNGEVKPHSIILPRTPYKRGTYE